MSTSKTFKDSKPQVTVVDFDLISNKATSKIAKKVFESIYPNRTNATPEKSDVSLGQKKLQERERQISLTPIPLKYYRDPKGTQKAKETNLSLRKSSAYSPQKQKTHKKVFSQQNYTQNSPSISPPCLLPINDVIQISHDSSKQVKNLHCAALNKLASYCESFMNTPLKNYDNESKKIVKDNKEMQFVTKAIQSYGIYDTKIQKELVRYSTNSRHDFDKERASLVCQIKDGSFDPNKTTVRMKTRIKRKSEDFF